MIDIIIPCHNSHDTLDRCIGSILAQRVLPSIHVTLVNDAGKPHTELIEKYKPLMDIREITYEENGGPAKARNFGIKNTTHPLLMFIDADDALGNPFATILLCNEIYENNSVMAVGTFIEEVAPLKFKKHAKDTSFMHGKMYRRSFLEKYNILQNENTRCNEDVGFNILAILIANTLKLNITYCDVPCYYWMFNPKSIVRSDKEAFDNGKSFQGFADNLTYVFEELEKRNLDSLDILFEKATTMQRLFLLYKEKGAKRPEFMTENKEHIKMFYDKIYRKIEDKVTPQIFDLVHKNLKFKGHNTKQEVKQFIRSLK